MNRVDVYCILFLIVLLIFEVIFIRMDYIKRHPDKYKKERLKMRELSPCPCCSSNEISVWVTAYPEKRRYYIACDVCHCATKKKRFLFRAKRAWNRQRRDGV